ncbi:MAG: hypothetical protein AAF383_07640 [Cyanobacteria bacterium P01_A01_bin.83]
MADMEIRGIPDWILEREKYFAKTQGISINARLRGLIKKDVQRVHEDMTVHVRKLREDTIAVQGLLPEETVVEMIREDRDARSSISLPPLMPNPPDKR